MARELEPVNLRKGKALNILYRIGQQPILAIGNSSGDCGMLAATIRSGYPATLRMLLNHDDAKREYAYPRASGSDAGTCREQAGDDILSISMRDDFEQVFHRFRQRPEAVAQLFAAGGTSLADGMAKIKAPILLITQPKDLVFTPDMVATTVKAAKDAGRDITHATIDGSRGHLDGVVSMKQAEGAIRAFLEK